MRHLLLPAFLAAAAAPLYGQAKKPAPAPTLRLNAEGPLAAVEAVAFSPDNKTLFTGGGDKTVRVWELRGGRFVRNDRRSLRVPLAPSRSGYINALAVSPDGRYLAAAGVGWFRGEAGFRGRGVVLASGDALDPEKRLDRGLIYVFDLSKPAPPVTALRGHHVFVTSLAFAPARAGKPPLLISAGPGDDGRAGSARVWDVAAGKQVASVAVPGVLPNDIPGVAAWHTGGRPGDLLVALAWDARDGNVRVWRPGVGLTTARDGVVTRPLIGLSGRGRVISGSVGGVAAAGGKSYSGQLRAWNVTGAATGRALLNVVPGDVVAPRAAALVSSGGRRKDLVAVVCRPAKDKTLRLALCGWDGRTGRLGRVSRVVRLWQYGPRVRAAVAASPDGRYLAVADAPGHGVHIYDVRELAAPRAAADPTQILRSGGARFTALRFVRDGGRLGLRLSRGGRSAVFDFDQSRLAAGDRGWAAAPFDAKGWSVRVAPAAEDGPVGAVVTWPTGRKAVPLGRVKARTAVTAVALPAAGKRPALLIAAAVAPDGFPRVRAYRVSDGVPVRDFAGHAAAVRAMAVSPDGRLLATVADDQTVRVWPLADFDRVIGKFGEVKGLAVRKKGGGLEIAKNLGAGLREGDGVVGFVAGGRVAKPAADAVAFYNAVLRTAPGKAVTLRVNRGGRAADVRLVTTQGADQRKALLAIYASFSGGRYDWVAWNPAGPYDDSGANAEGWIGWHINPALPGGRPRFVPAATYRRQYRRPKIAKYIAQFADLRKALDAWERNELPKRPKVGLRLDGLIPGEADGVYLVRDRDVTLRLEPTGAGFRPDLQVESASFRWADGRDRPLAEDPDSPGTYAAGLAGLDWKRGEVTVTATLKTTKPAEAESPARLRLRYLPPPPRVTLTRAGAVNNPALPADAPVFDVGAVGAAVFPVRAAVEKGAAGEEFRVRTRFNGGAWRDAGAKVSRTLTLRRGENLFEILAQNTEGGDAEATRRAVRVLYQPDRAAARPRVTVEAVIAGGERLAVVPGEPVRVSAATVRVTGTVVATANLTAATLAGRPMDGFKPRAAKTFAFDQEVKLKPGVNGFPVSAAADGAEASAAVEVAYTPAPPRALFVAPREGQRLTPADGAPNVRLRLRFEPGDDPRPFGLKVSVNGDPAGGGDVAAGGRRWEGPITLKPGRNEITVTLTNRWGGTRAARSEVVFARPPVPRRVIAPAKAGAVRTTPATLTALFACPDGMPPTGASLSRKGEPRPLELPAGVFKEAGAEAKAGLRLYRFEFKAALAEGENAFTVVARNRDGAGPALRFPALRFVAQFVPPEVLILNPPVLRATTKDPDLNVRFEVQSQGQLVGLTLLRGGEVLQRFDPAKGQRDPLRGGLRFAADVKLKIGVNSLRVRAVNRSGPTSKDFVVSYTPPPARVVIESIDPDGPAGPVEPAAVTDQSVRFPELPAGRARLRGKLVFADGRAAKKDFKLRVGVNGFLALPVPVDRSSNPKERPFEVRLVLDRAGPSRIRLLLEGEDFDQPPRADCLVAGCAAPVREVRYHALLIGLSRDGADGIKRRVLKAFGAKGAGKPRRYSRTYTGTSPKAELTIYNPLYGNVERTRVYPLIDEIRKRLPRPGRGDAPHDIVLLYYEGAEEFRGRDHVLHTSSTEISGDEVIHLEDLAKKLKLLSGAQVLVMDVAEAGRSSEGVSDHLRESWTGLDNVGRLRLAHDVAEKKPARLLLRALSEAMPAAADLRGAADRVRTTLSGPKTAGRLDGVVPSFVAPLPFGGRRPK